MTKHILATGHISPAGTAVTVATCTNFSAFVEAMTADGYAMDATAVLTFYAARCGKCFVFDVVQFQKETTVITVLVKGAGATIAEALETARVRIIG